MIQTPQSPARQRDLRVLVAEDSDVNRRLAAGLLKREGFRVTLADNGAHAVSELQKSRYDVVLMDVDMPIMDGLAATRTIRQQERITGRYTPVIALTTNMNQHECLEAGMDGFLNKPLNVDAFRRVIADISRGDAASY